MLANGLIAYGGMNVMMKRISRGCGMLAYDVDVTCDDLQVIGCHSSGVCVNSDATVTLSGEIRNTVVLRLDATSSNAKIHLVTPPTKEQISTNNGGGGNWGRKKGSTIDQVDNDGVVLQILYKGQEEVWGPYGDY